MNTITKVLQNNTIVKRLIAEGELSQSHLKKVYRELCKHAHPDLKNRDSVEFIQIQEEYEQAKKHLCEIKKIFNKSEDSHPFLSVNDIRKQFYQSLYHYTAAGMHSVRVRIKPEIRKRNTTLLQQVLYWAKFYNPAFIDIFLKYNKAYFRRFHNWQKKDKFVKAQRLFLRGLRDCFDYERNGNIRTYRASQSFLEDAVSNLKLANQDSLSLSLLEYAEWMMQELKTLHTYYTTNKDIP